jgi:hypothetical protein
MPAVIVDPSRARAAGWSPRYDFREGLRGVWEEWSAADAEAMAGPLSVPGVVAAGGSSSAGPSGRPT